METRFVTQHLSRRAEDYLEAILNVILEKGYARTTDVAHKLAVSPSSVVEMFRKLDALHLICYRRYEGAVFLPEGREIAEHIKYRHDTLKKFILIIGVSEKIADADACFMEHELHPDTVRRIHHFIAYTEENPSVCEQIQRFSDAIVR
ncbi:MAG: metal-dependent transcriptional regulator [Methanomicrobiales archaeon]|nr:metal-dependent transcriptional regulator [Methanomicrobiales archaeon]